MFRAGECSAGAATEFAGVDRFATFAAACERHGIPLIDYSPEQLQVEVESLRLASRCSLLPTRPPPLRWAACDGAIQGEYVEAVVEPRTSRSGESEIAG